jgi:hypothetical protein
MSKALKSGDVSFPETGMDRGFNSSIFFSRALVNSRENRGKE